MFNTVAQPCIIKKVFPVEAQSQPDRQLTRDQQCALRYVAGYILRNVKDKIQSKLLRVQYKDEALTVLEEMSTEDTAGSTDETFLSYSRRWINLINRGGLYVISDEVYMAFQAMELAFQEYLCRGTVGNHSKDAAVNPLGPRTRKVVNASRVMCGLAPLLNFLVRTDYVR